MGSENTQPRTKLPDARHTPRFAGVATFGRFPAIDAVAPESLPIDWAIYGVPYDGGVTYRPGARFGPRAIRDASQYIKPYHLDLDVNIAEVLSLADAGDAPIAPYSCKQTLEDVAGWAESIGDPSHTRLLAIGGDHSIAYANMRATWQRRGASSSGLALLHFDAHLDTTDSVWGEKWTHASPFIRAIEDGYLDPERMLSIGIRGPMNTADDLSFARERGIEIITFEQWRSGDGAARYEAFLSRISTDELYLSFDIDSVDPAFAPGTGTPCCGGFTSAEAFALLRRTADSNLVGADIVEVLPDRDHAEMTTLLASHVMLEILAAAAVGMAGP